VGTIEADELPIKQQMIESSAKVIGLAAKEKFKRCDGLLGLSTECG
jgi:DeoR/GlpR family transcriptional regulator of sugar metabolism